MRFSRRSAVIMLAALSGCETTSPQTAPPPIVAARSPPMRPVGLERVLGQSAAALVDLFGKPDRDVREQDARRLQFGSGICILDAYLYPSDKGREPIVSYVDARQPNGADIDRASCVAALTRRREAR